MPNPDENTPLLLLLVLATRNLVDALQERQVAAGFEDHRVVHHNVMAHVTYDGIRLTALAERAGITKQAMSELVADLERLGYLERTPDPQDRRAKLITFSARGHAAVVAARAAFTDIEAQLTDRLGAEAVAALRRGLLELAQHPITPPGPSAR